MMGLIHRDTEAQLTTITEARGARQGLEDVAQQDAALAEQASAAAYSLSEQATRLLTLVEKFKINPVGTPLHTL